MISSTEPIPFTDIETLLCATEFESQGVVHAVRRYIEGSILIGESGVYLIGDMLSLDVICNPAVRDPETMPWPRYPDGVTLFRPGVYQVESLVTEDTDPSSTRLVTVVHCPDTSIATWKHYSYAPITEHYCFTVITPDALARWIEQEEAEDSVHQGKSKRPATDPSFWDETVDLMDGVPDKAFWEAQGFRFNEQANGEGVFVPGSEHMHVYWGYHVNQMLAAIVCHWL